MDKTTLEKFFTAKFLKIPTYQRDYAWAKENVDDLFTDVAEALETATNHYIGTFILSHTPGAQLYNVVDGQQRLTTLTMLFHALVAHLPAADVEARIIRGSQFLIAEGRPRLELLGANEAFFRAVLNGAAPRAETSSQRRLSEAYAHIAARVAALSIADAQQIKRWLNCTAALEVMEFIEQDDGRAIRIFQTINDRGRPLSNMEKAKSLLIYYSNRFLGGALDTFVNDEFGHIFRAYDTIKERAALPTMEIGLIKLNKFTEDTVMRYHFLAYPSDWHEYGASAADVLDNFLKCALKQRQSEGQKALTDFITSYASDLRGFFQALRDLVSRVDTDSRYYKLFSTLNLSATLYPITVRLAMRGMLDAEVPNNPRITFRDLIEAVDVRVYKTRGTNPERDIANLAQAAAGAQPKDIADALLNFTKRFMSDAQFRAALEGEMYRNQGLHLMLLEYEEHIRVVANEPRFDLPSLKRLATAVPSIEHVFAQEPTFALAPRGFADRDDYTSTSHQFGNLCLLEEALNSRARNRVPETKASDDKLYKASAFRLVRDLGVQIQQKAALWVKADVEARTATLTDFVLIRWPLWKTA